MATLHLLGTGAAVCDPHRTTTMLALEWDSKSLLVDCGGDLFQRALMADLDPEGIEGLILTHEHPDHVGGFPLFMERLWLAGRSRPLKVYGIAPALAQAQRALEAFQTSSWNLPELLWRKVSLEEGAPVLTSEDWTITASPGKHGVPVIGLRFRHESSSVELGYSCDTEPCAAIDRLMLGCDLVVHEATGAGRGHCSVEQAVDAGKKSGASHLILVHLGRGTTEEDITPFRDGSIEIVLGDELDRFDF